MTINEYKEEVKLVRPQMLAIARNYLKDNDEAEDAVQDVLLKLWQLIDTLRLPMAPLFGTVEEPLHWHSSPTSLHNRSEWDYS